MQPESYTPVTNFADDERNNAGGRTTVRADRVDAELAAVAASLNRVIANLEILQRDDGYLRDGIVEAFNFSASAKSFFMATKWNARGLWATTQVYSVNDLVDKDGAAYICAIPHASGVFATDYAAGKWQIFTNVATASALSFTPSSTISSTNTQAAVSEVDTKNRALSNPSLSAFYGGL